jgi:hypothetical protein
LCGLTILPAVEARPFTWRRPLAQQVSDLLVVDLQHGRLRIIGSWHTLEHCCRAGITQETPAGIRREATFISKLQPCAASSAAASA